MAFHHSCFIYALTLWRQVPSTSETLTGFEPVIAILQTAALPLGYRVFVTTSRASSRHNAHSSTKNAKGKHGIETIARIMRPRAFLNSPSYYPCRLT